jgi:hypothetical protein
MKTATKKKSKEKSKTEKLDRVFSLYIRHKAGGYCQKCKKFFGVNDLDAAHMFVRGRFTTRWDERNVFALCEDCHREVDNNHFAKTSFHCEMIPMEEIAELELLSNKTTKDCPIDKDALYKKYKQLLEAIE